MFLGILLQNFLEKTNAKDASGNTVLGDFGVYIQQEVRYKQTDWLGLEICLIKTL